MNPATPTQVLRTIVAGVGIAVATYAAFAAVTWLRYGEERRWVPGEEDPLLDRFMPLYEIVERHHVQVEAPAAVTLATAKEQDLLRSGLVRAIFKTREVVLGADAEEMARPRALLPQMLALGWAVLAEEPGREIIAGAVTRPWEANVVFTPLTAEQFIAFTEPGYVKIAWTLRADPVDGGSIFRTETRAIATDPIARARFRRYWSLVAPGVILIRRLSLAPLKKDAERRALAMHQASV